jgi:hypothetical protein
MMVYHISGSCDAPRAGRRGEWGFVRTQHDKVSGASPVRGDRVGGAFSAQEDGAGGLGLPRKTGSVSVTPIWHDESSNRSGH